LALQYCPLSLQEFIQSKSLGMELRIQICHQIAQGLDHLHSLNIGIY
jgi:serine/threonine protein kinase